MLKAGDWLSLDGSTGEVFKGQAKTIDADPTSGVFASFMSWADEFRGSFGVRANADIPRDAQAARRFGAEGIGLCRTEHMFFAEDRLEHVQAMILATDEKSRRKALAKLLPMQRSDFAGLFKAMDGFPVVIRTLDPPLHEFLPKREELMVDLAKLPHADSQAKKEMSKRYKIAVGDLKKQIPILLKRVEELHEFNPMLGHRGCRLGVTYPEITEMQARAIFEAAVQVAKKGVKVIPEVMIPLIGGVKELANQKAIVVRVAEEVLAKAGVKDLKYYVGTMIEIPRAALTADLVAKEADFFSFGTNDLTQTTMGLSRDDYTKFQKDYEKAKIFDHDPFAVLDQEGVGKLIEYAVKLGRATRPDLEVGICGEHGGEPSSVMFCYRAGMNYVSCSPYRVPIARLAAAQAAISGDKSDQMIAVVGSRERRKIVLAFEQRSQPNERALVERIRKMVHVPPVERRQNFRPVNPVLIRLGDRVVPRMKLSMSLLHRQHAHRVRQQPVDRLAEIVNRYRILDAERRHLRQRVDPGVGAPRPRYLNRFPFDFPDDTFERALNRRKPRLNLPAVKIRAVVGHGDPDAAHEIERPFTESLATPAWRSAHRSGTSGQLSAV